MRAALPVGLALIAAAALVTGCSEDETTGANTPGSHEPCKSEPWSCPEGETCWIDYAGVELICQMSGPGQQGDSCTNDLGRPTCGDGLGCYHVRGRTPGVCSPFCDSVAPAHRCADGAACRPLLYNTAAGDVILNICEPPGVGGGGSGGGSAGGGGSGGAPEGGGGSAGG